jgi:hypothetical protein
MTDPSRRKALIAALSWAGGAAAIVPATASAQAGPTVPSSGGGATVGGAQAPTSPPQPGSTYVPMPGPQGFTFGPSTTSPSGPIGGGNATESSARPVVGDEEDSFDLGPHRTGGGIAHGDDNGPVFLGGPSYQGGEVPYSHVVRRGDTLWDICGSYFQNPYQWPRIWSYNPQIKNPHWIYPGDQVRLRQGGEEATGGPPTTALPYQKMTLVDRRRQVPSDTVFLRDTGWIHDPSDEVFGDITGAAEDKMFLSDFDEVYLHVDEGHEVKLGQELTVFRPLHVSAAGTVVKILGTVRVDQWNARDRVARAQIVESLDVIERGAKVGPMVRRFEVVPPRRNDVDVQAHVLASVTPHEFFGQNQVVFIDKGEKDGLRLGNRLFVVRRGDAWRETLVTPGAGYRISPDDEKPMPPMQKTPGSRRDEERYPDEVVGELRVVALKKDTATCLVTGSRSEIEPYDLAVARKGY